MTILSSLSAMGVRPQRLISDSRQVRPGDTFIAYRGAGSDGRRFIAQALAAGASAVLWEQEGFVWHEEWQVPNLGVPQLREQVGPIASAFYGEPSGKLWMVGVTGTNGKTSCSHWLAQSMSALGRKTAVIGTLGNGFLPHPGPLPQAGEGDAVSLRETASPAMAEAVNTTPDPILLHGLLADYLKRGAQAVAMEVSSHGLAQGRVNGMKFDVAVLTNLSRDHLDYHGDMQAYAATKQTLFFWPGLKCAVLNQDDAFGAQLAVHLTGQKTQVMTYGFGKGDVSGSNLQLGAEGVTFDVTAAGETVPLSAPVLGRFNAYNLLAALSVLLASGVALRDAVAALVQVQPVTGRMQQLGGGELPLVVVDYAHTPDALEKVLASLREQTTGRLICVFGCGGNRDKGKRPLMGKAVADLADFAVVTSDNPRHENARGIIDDIVAGMTGDYHVEKDRAAAIDQALRQAVKGDVVLIAGKGHETYQEIGNDKLPFNDVEVAIRVLADMGRAA